MCRTMDIAYEMNQALHSCESCGVIYILIVLKYFDGLADDIDSFTVFLLDDCMLVVNLEAVWYGAWFYLRTKIFFLRRGGNLPPHLSV